MLLRSELTSEEAFSTLRPALRHVLSFEGCRQGLLWECRRAVANSTTMYRVREP